MEALIGKHADNVKIITPQDEAHCFFVYHDMRATHGEHSRHPAPHVPITDRLPTAEDGVFLVDMETDIPTIIDVRCDLHARFVWGGKYISFDTTHNGRRDIAVLPSDVLDF